MRIIISSLLTRSRNIRHICYEKSHVRLRKDIELCEELFNSKLMGLRNENIFI